MNRERLARFRTYGLVLVLLLAVATLTTFTLRTTLQLDHLREQSVIEATAAVATEKATRIDRQIIDQDNVVAAIADPVRLPELAERFDVLALKHECYPELILRNQVPEPLVA